MVNGKAVIDVCLCDGCGRCIPVCPEKAIGMDVMRPHMFDLALKKPHV